MSNWLLTARAAIVVVDIRPSIVSSIVPCVRTSSTDLSSVPGFQFAESVGRSAAGSATGSK